MILTHTRKTSAGNHDTLSGSRRIKPKRVGIGRRNRNGAGDRGGISMDSKGITAYGLIFPRKSGHPPKKY